MADAYFGARVKQYKKHELSLIDGQSPLVEPATLVLSEANASLLEYWLMLRPRLRVIAALTIAIVVMTFVLDGYVRTQWYRATAIIRPASREGPISPLATMIGSTSLAQSLSALTSVGSLGDEIANDAAKYMTLLKSYDFTVDLVRRHKLQPMLYRKSRIGELLHPWAKPPTTSEARHWFWYKAMGMRFSYHYDDRDGNLVLRFISPDQAEAKQVLQYYIDDLRARLRNRAVRETDAAVISLKGALRQTSDPLLEQQLAMLVAEQIQQEKTAQAEADFAFAVLEPPFVSQSVYKPKTALQCIVALFLTPLLCFIAVILYHRAYLPIRDAQRILSGGHAGQEANSAQENGLSAQNGSELKMLEK